MSLWPNVKCLVGIFQSKARNDATLSLPALAVSWPEVRGAGEGGKGGGVTVQELARTG